MIDQDLNLLGIDLIFQKDLVIIHEDHHNHLDVVEHLLRILDASRVPRHEDRHRQVKTVVATQTATMNAHEMFIPTNQAM